MNPQLFADQRCSSDAEWQVRFRDSPIRTEEARGSLVFRLVRNDGTHASYEALTGLKNIFQRQLPKMPREYISRLVYDTKHGSLAIVRPATGSATVDAVIGGITFRLFKALGFCEIVFCAISSSEQVKGFGATLMNELKAQVEAATQGAVTHYLTYADNYAIGYFKKQGFTKRISLPRTTWGGHIKDYEGGTLMQCTVLPTVDYRRVYRMVYSQKIALVRRIAALTACDRILPPIYEAREDGSAGPALDPSEVPGVAAAGWSKEQAATMEAPRRGRLYEMLRPLLGELQSHPAAWPFLKPVDAEEVPSYYAVITRPMDLSRMRAKLEDDLYESLPAFIGDFNRIIENCRLFNDADTSYCKNAANLEKFFQDRLRARDSHIH